MWPGDHGEHSSVKRFGSSNPVCGPKAQAALQLPLKKILRAADFGASAAKP